MCLQASHIMRCSFDFRLPISKGIGQNSWNFALKTCVSSFFPLWSSSNLMCLCFCKDFDDVQGPTIHAQINAFYNRHHISLSCA